jgi:hypothetical protein
VNNQPLTDYERIAASIWLGVFPQRCDDEEAMAWRVRVMELAETKFGPDEPPLTVNAEWNRWIKAGGDYRDPYSVFKAGVAFAKTQRSSSEATDQMKQKP